MTDDRDDLYRVMDLKALRCFWAAGRLGSLTRAGIDLGISKSAVSQRIRALEGYLGAKLYETRGGRIRLTPAGDRVLEMAVGLFERIDDFETGLSTQEVTGEITISAQDSEQLYLLPDVVSHDRRDYPQVRLRLLSRSVHQTITSPAASTSAWSPASASPRTTVRGWRRSRFPASTRARRPTALCCVRTSIGAPRLRGCSPLLGVED